MDYNDVKRLRESSTDSSLMNYLYEQDDSFRTAVDNVAGKNQEMSPFERRKFATVMLDMHYQPTQEKEERSFDALSTKMIDDGMKKVEKNFLTKMSPLAEDVSNISQDAIQAGASGMNEYATRIRGGLKDYRGPRLIEEGYAGPNIGLTAGLAGMVGRGAFNASRALMSPVESVVGQGIETLNTLSEARGPSPTAPQGPAITADDVQNIQSAWQEVSSKSPESAAILEGILGAGMMYLSVQGGAQMIEKVGGGVGRVGQGATNLVRKSPEQLRNQVDDVVGQITQATDKRDIAEATKALSEVDTRGVKTYDDLVETIDDHGRALMSSQDDYLAQFSERIHADEFAKTVKVGARTATKNPVREALAHLEEYYRKLGSPDDLLRIQSISDTANGVGLTRMELNRLVQEYGRVRSGFSAATGNPLTSVNAKTYEANRKALKLALRESLPDETSKILDLQMHRNIDLLDQIDDVALKVQAMQNRLVQRGLMDKVIAKAVNIGDALTFRSFSGFMRAVLPFDDLSLRTDYLGIEKLLAKNLKKLSRLASRMDDMPDDQLVRAVAALAVPDAGDANAVMTYSAAQLDTTPQKLTALVKSAGNDVNSIRTTLRNSFGSKFDDIISNLDDTASLGQADFVDPLRQAVFGAGKPTLTPSPVTP